MASPLRLPNGPDDEKSQKRLSESIREKPYFLSFNGQAGIKSDADRIVADTLVAQAEKLGMTAMVSAWTGHYNDAIPRERRILRQHRVTQGQAKHFLETNPGCTRAEFCDALYRDNETGWTTETSKAQAMEAARQRLHHMTKVKRPAHAIMRIDKFGVKRYFPVNVMQTYGDAFALAVATDPYLAPRLDASVRPGEMTHTQRDRITEEIDRWIRENRDSYDRVTIHHLIAVIMSKLK